MRSKDSKVSSKDLIKSIKKYKRKKTKHIISSSFYKLSSNSLLSIKTVPTINKNNLEKNFKPYRNS